MVKNKRPFKKFFCDRDDVFLLPPIAFKVWMFHYRCEREDRKSWPSVETLCKKCNINKKTLFRCRGWLEENGWLTKIASKRSSQGRFSSPVFRVKRGNLEFLDRVPPDGSPSDGIPSNGSDHIPPEGSPTVTHSRVLEVDKDSLSRSNEVEDSDMSFKTNISDTALKILGVQIFPGDIGWDGLNSYKRVHGQSETVQIFEQWAIDNQGEEIKYPLTDFLRVAGRYFDKKFVQKIDARPLILALACISDGQVTFNQKQSIEIARLLETYSETEIKEAFKEFLSGLDEFKMNYAARDFAGGAAEQIIYTQRKRKEESARLVQTLNDLSGTEQAAAQKQIENLEIARQAEKELVEDEL